MMGQKTNAFRPPEGLIACSHKEYTRICWRSVPEAESYNLYARPDEAADGDYSALDYVRLNEAPLKVPVYEDKIRRATYRVTAVDGQGRESDFSEMVFPVKHNGLEILAIRYFSGEKPLLCLPDTTVSIRITAVNSTGMEETVLLRAGLDGRRKEFPLVLPGDSLLHEYTVLAGNVETAPITAAVYDKKENCISCVSRFRPVGLKLYDTLFEKGLLLCEPQREVLYDGTDDGAVGDGYLNKGKPFEHCQIQFRLCCESLAKEPFVMELGKLRIAMGIDGKLEVRLKGAVLGRTRIWNSAMADEWTDGSADRKDEAANSRPSYITDDPGGSDGSDCKRREVILHVYAGSEVLQIFLNGEHLPAVTAETHEAHGALRFTGNGWTVSKVYIGNQKASFAGILPFGCANPEPVWNIACWHSHYNWIRDGKADPVIAGRDGSMEVKNPARSLWRSADGSEVILKAKGSIEYEHTRRREEGWTHLLLEVLWDRPELGRLAVCKLKSLWLTMDIRLLQCENKTAGYDPSIHAGQFVVYFNISGIRNEAMWLGLCNMDSRFLMDENRREIVYQMDPGTNTFIIAPPQNQFIAGHLADGQWHSMSLDLKPVILQAYEYGRQNGAFTKTSVDKLLLNSMNFGFEIPGTFDMAAKFSNLQLAAEMEDTE